MKEIRHLKKINAFEDFKKCHGHHYGFLDIDTFFSIAISLLAAKNGISGIYSELNKYTRFFNVDCLALAILSEKAGRNQEVEFVPLDIYKQRVYS